MRGGRDLGVCLAIQTNIGARHVRSLLLIDNKFQEQRPPFPEAV
jgi:hypothetical protein